MKVSMHKDCVSISITRTDDSAPKWTFIGGLHRANEPSRTLWTLPHSPGLLSKQNFHAHLFLPVSLPCVLKSDPQN